MKNFKKAFTMMELIFVIVIMGILAKFGVEFLTTAYSGFINSTINNQLQQNSAAALEFVGARLQYRIKASTIAREPSIGPNANEATPINLYFGLNNNAPTANILEWIGYDIEGYRGGTTGTWSGVLDLNLTRTNATQLFSLATNTTDIGTLVNALSYGSSDMNSTAIYFINPDGIVEDNITKFGWDMNLNLAARKDVFDNQDNVYIHPIDSGATPSIFSPIDADGNPNNFTNVLASEFYQLAWTAYAVGIKTPFHPDGDNNLTLWYDYQPWQGEVYTDGKEVTIMQHVSSFQFIARESIIKIQVCVKSLLLIQEGEEYSICKEKTIF